MTPRAVLDIAVVAGEPRPKWCPDCKAETAAAVDLHALLPGGLVYLTTVAVCEICDDPGEEARA